MTSLGTLETTDTESSNELNVRKLLQQFIRLPQESELEFTCKIGHGRVVVQRMRVKLSRLREKAKILGRNVQEFKMIIEVLEIRGDRDFVRLRKTKNRFTDEKEMLRRMEEDFTGLLED